MFFFFEVIILKQLNSVGISVKFQIFEIETNNFWLN